MPRERRGCPALGSGVRGWGCAGLGLCRARAVPGAGPRSPRCGNQERSGGAPAPRRGRDERAAAPGAPGTRSARRGSPQPGRARRDKGRPAGHGVQVPGAGLEGSAVRASPPSRTALPERFRRNCGRPFPAAAAAAVPELGFTLFRGVFTSL